MANFFGNLEFETAQDIEQLARLMYELRCNRSEVLDAYGVSDEVALLERVYAGELAEHPTYEHYLAARILAETRETVRMLLAEQIKEARKS
ncbi:MAG TPA: hypothetical protein PK725_12855 [Rhodocyclaceae bacterium]|nr:hypothetical protein [Rhodocyclaceae bacterium]